MLGGKSYDVKYEWNMWFFRVAGEDHLGWTAASKATSAKIERQLKAYPESIAKNEDDNAGN
jgi:hypothetical protein